MITTTRKKAKKASEMIDYHWFDKAAYIMLVLIMSRPLILKTRLKWKKGKSQMQKL